MKGENSNNRGMKIKLLVVVIVLVVLLGGVYLWKRFIAYETNKFLQKLKSPVSSVSTAFSENKTWQESIAATGSTVANEGVNINAEVAGTITNIYFKSGQVVKKGQVLLQLNPDVLKATLANQKAALHYAKTSFARQRRLMHENAVSKESFDQAQLNYKQAKASVRQTEAMLAQTTVRAPFAGVLGIRAVNVGQYLTLNTSIVTLTALQPMYVDFSLAENQVANIKVGQKVRLSVGAYPNKTFDGKVTAINSTLDSTTRTLQVRAEVNNSQNLLLPNMFANIALLTGKVDKVTVVPQIAINYAPSGDYVYVIKDNIANRQYIHIGERRGAKIAVTKGLKAQEQVVYAGQVKLRNGSKVVVENPKQGEK